MKKIVLIMLAALFSAVSGVFAQGYKRALPVESMAPEIDGVDQNGEAVQLTEILADGRSAVVIFYRGNWCGYCEKHLSLLQDSLEYILNRNATVIVVTPESPEGVKSMLGKTGATYSILHDEGYKIMKDYQVDYVISPETVTKYLGPVTKRTAEANGNEDGVLPVPATYIIRPDRIIAWVHYNPVYSQRSSVFQILQHLE
jgi:peroxiredoxin